MNAEQIVVGLVMAALLLSLSACGDPRPRDPIVEREAMIECINAAGNSGDHDTLIQCRAFSRDVARSAFNNAPQSHDDAAHALLENKP